MVQGQTELSADELLSCFTLPSASEEAAAAAGFDDVGARAADDFEEMLHDGDLLDAPQRLKLLSWCTALTVLHLRVHAHGTRHSSHLWLF